MEIKRVFDFVEYQYKHHLLEAAFVQKINGQWVPTSTESYRNQANAISRGLLKKGIKKGDRIALITSSNRTEWNICDIGIAQIGAISVPVYPTISKDDYEYIFKNSEVKMCIVSDIELYNKVSTIKPNIPSLEEIFVFEEDSDKPNWSLLKEKENRELNTILQEAKNNVSSEDLLTIIYTSGTTGVPKGVMLSHNNIVSNVMDSRPRIPDGISIVLSFLPCCHIFERTLLYVYQYKGSSIYFAESIDAIGDNIREVKPKFMSVVPRLLEKVYNKIVAKGEQLKGIKRFLFYWAISVGERYTPFENSGLWYNMQLKIAKKLVFSKWKEALGGNLKGMVSGSAALQPRLARIFSAAGMLVVEGYGATETSPVVSVNAMKKELYRVGTVGKPIDNVEVKIAADGEILVKGPNVMKGYYKDKQKTAEVMTGDYYHTGDIGELEDGFLKITDRKKEIFKTSGGKYIAPQKIENLMKQSRFIEQIMVVGEGEKMPCALIQIDFEFIKKWMQKHDIKCENSLKSISQNEKVRNRILLEVESIGKHLGKWEKIKKIEITPDIWTIDDGHLTPTMKLKRKMILEKYKFLYDKMYS